MLHGLLLQEPLQLSSDDFLPQLLWLAFESLGELSLYATELGVVERLVDLVLVEVERLVAEEVDGEVVGQSVELSALLCREQRLPA
jgi:hypothetical protein